MKLIYYILFIFFIGCTASEKKKAGFLHKNRTPSSESFIQIQKNSKKSRGSIYSIRQGFVEKLDILECKGIKIGSRCIGTVKHYNEVGYSGSCSGSVASVEGVPTYFTARHCVPDRSMHADIELLANAYYTDKKKNYKIKHASGDRLAFLTYDDFQILTYKEDIAIAKISSEAASTANVLELRDHRKEPLAVDEPLLIEGFGGGIGPNTMSCKFSYTTVLDKIDYFDSKVVDGSLVKIPTYFVKQPFDQDKGIKLVNTLECELPPNVRSKKEHSLSDDLKGFSGSGIIDSKNKLAGILSHSYANHNFNELNNLFINFYIPRNLYGYKGKVYQSKTNSTVLLNGSHVLIEGGIKRVKHEDFVKEKTKEWTEEFHELSVKDFESLSFNVRAYLLKSRKEGTKPKYVLPELYSAVLSGDGQIVEIYYKAVINGKDYYFNAIQSESSLKQSRTYDHYNVDNTSWQKVKIKR